ncbi:MAG: FlgO family outer membrane protein [Candidatus Paceibacterota bacterium]
MKKLIFVLTVFSFLFLSPHSLSAQASLGEKVGELSTQISKQIESNEKTKIAVVEFSDLQGNVTDFGRFLAEELITRFYQTNKFTVVERQMLNKVIEEQKLTLKGMVDPSSAKELGKILGVDAIVSGTITDLSNSLRVNARIMNTETGEIFGAASTQIYKNDSVIQLMSSGTDLSDNTGDNSNNSGKEESDDVTYKAVSNSLLFELNEITSSGNTVKFSLTVTNKGEERDFYLYGDYSRLPTRLYDDQGKEYLPSQVKVGNDSDDARAEMDQMVKGVPIDASITFNNISDKVTKFTLIQIAYRVLNDGGKIEFRDIPLNFGK